MRLGDRRAILTLDTIKIECVPGNGIDLTFDVEKTTSAKPNTAKIEVFNLTKEHNDQILEKASGDQTSVRVRLEAGYKEQISCIWDGNIRYSYVKHTDSDTVLTLESGDNEHLINTARINRSWGPGTPVELVIKDIADSMGIGRGNLLQKIQNAALKGYGSAFTGGTVASGSAIKEFGKLLKSCDLEWSIQDGVLQILSNGQALEGIAVVVSPTTGMIGSPSIDQKKKRGTSVKVQMLLIPDVFPGRKLSIESDTVTGFFRIEKAKYSGDTAGQDWYISCDCKAL
jgi:hypothetical protein